MNRHLVQFYEDDAFLIAGLADYLGPALANGDTAIAIATATHLASLQHTLAERGLVDDHGHARAGHFIPLKAERMLALILEDGVPSEPAFRSAIGGLIGEAAARGSPRVYLYAEMVAILSDPEHSGVHAARRHDAVVKLERCFNKLQQAMTFSLMCSYPLAAFPAAADAHQFDEICGLHSHVLPAESYDPHANVQALQRTIASLQQQAHSLAAEVHDRLQVERALREVNVDRLTGLPNRNVFHDRLDMDIKKAHRSGLPLALLFIDLDHFKEINDTLGHDIGDLLLKQVGQRLQAYVRETDTVARLGGDEFTITLADLHDTGKVTDVAQKIRNDLARPFRLKGELAYISASIGITLYPRDAQNAGDLLRNADQAMYQSKDHGRNRFTYFTPSMQEAAQARMAMSNELRRALDDGQLDVHYQPIVAMDSGRICKAEALMRWQHPQLGQVSPVDFIPIAEHTGLIVDLGNWVFRTALTQARRWREHDADMTVNVNVSPAQFYHANGENCRNWVGNGAFAAIAGASTPEVGLEITEGLLLASNSLVLKQLLAFQQAGIKISLDDFGTGYSSLSYLRKFDLDFLKIDKSFVYNLENDAANVALCEAIIVMAHKLGLKVVAEGVETRQQYEVLRHAGCDYGQGYLFGAPLPARAFEALLREGHALAG
jgi:diguanylate cyclase (GGDEF)-like protein